MIAYFYLYYQENVKIFTEILMQFLMQRQDKVIKNEVK